MTTTTSTPGDASAELEDRLRGALQAEAQRAPLRHPTWSGPAYPLAERRRRPVPWLAAAAAVAVVTGIGVVALARRDHGTVPSTATEPLDARPRALPVGLTGWTLADAADDATWSDGQVGVQRFRRADSAVLRVSSPGQDELAGWPTGPAFAPTTAAVPGTDAASATQSSGRVRGVESLWIAGSGVGILTFVEDGTPVTVEAAGLDEEAVRAAVDAMGGRPGAYTAPSEFEADGSMPPIAPGRRALARAEVTRDATGRSVTVEAHPFTGANDTFDPNLSLPLAEAIGAPFVERLRADGTLTWERQVDGATAVTWAVPGAQLWAWSGPDTDRVDVREVVDATRPVTPASWLDARSELLARWQRLPLTAHVDLAGDAAWLEARGGDVWPAVLCLQVAGAADLACARNQTQAAEAGALSFSVMVDGAWWIIGVADDRLSAQSGITPDAGATTLDRRVQGGKEWFAARLPQAATWATGELSSVSGAGTGGPWLRP